MHVLPQQKLHVVVTPHSPTPLHPLVPNYTGMSRSTLHTPFAQQHSAGTSSSSRVSPFQQAAATLQSLESDDLESGWSNNHYGPGLRQRYLDVFEPLRTTARSSSGGGMRDRGGHDQLQVRLQLVYACSCLWPGIHCICCPAVGAIKCSISCLLCVRQRE